MVLIPPSPPPEQPLRPLPEWPQDVDVSLLRSDLMHADYGGNKLYKLHYTLQEAAASGLPILTFGGAWSNHLAATAAAARDAGLQSIGIVRGGELHSGSNPVLALASTCGMELHFVSRTDYRRREDPTWHAELRTALGDFYLIPEGGTNAHAVRGCRHLLGPQHHSHTRILCATGTGGTLAGLAAAAQPHQTVTGIAVVNDGPRIIERVTALLQPWPQAAPWTLRTDHTCGGYGRTTPDLLAFIARAAAFWQIPLEPTYTGKLLFALHQMILAGEVPDEKLLILHSGGYRFSHGNIANP